MTRFAATFLFLATAATVTGCSKSDAGDPASDTNAAPGVEVTAAPRVAFRYAYAFRLPAPRIAAAQERHADACEWLGPARCRVTAMRYLRAPDNDVDAELRFSIAPDLARSFGRQAIGVVESNEGGVRSVEVTGDDAGAQIDAARASAKAAAADRAALDARMAGTGGIARTELERQRGDLGQAIRTADAQAAGQRALLNATPMVFRYESGKTAPGFETPSALARAADLFGWSADVTFGALMSVLGVALPPMALAAMLLGLFLGGRRMIRRRIAPVA